MLAVCSLVLVTILHSAHAGGVLELSAEQVEIPGFGTAEDVALVVEPATTSGRLTVARLHFAEMSVANLVVVCEQLRVTSQSTGCAGPARFQADFGPVEARVRWTYENRTDRLEFSADGELFEGQIRLAGRLDAEGLTGNYTHKAIRLERLIPLVLADYAIHGGTVSGRGEVRQPAGSEDLQVSGDLAVEAFSFDNPDGSLAAAGLDLKAELEAVFGAERRTFKLDATPGAGEVLIGSLYLDFGSAAPRLEIDGSLGGEDLKLESGRLTDPDVLAVRVRGQGRLDDLTRGQWQVDVDQAVLPGAYDRYLANLFQSLGLGKFQTAGKIRGGAHLADRSLVHATVDLREVTLNDSAGRFSVMKLNGLIDYDRAGDSADSSLSWEGGRIYQVPIDSGTSRFIVAGQEFQLLDPLEVGVFDGSVTVGTLAMSDFGEPDMSLDFEAKLTPIALRPVTEALGWPPLSGTLSGEIPRVRLRDEVVEVGGTIELAVFDGSARFEKLRLERLFGVLPTLAGDLILTDLDLQQMTGAFSFGEIRGRIEGGLRNLRLLDWQPVAFDMTLHTPEDDGSTHRISQRAVENLTSIGGGPTAVLSSSFLRFFDNFRYEKLGLACRLRNNVCEMQGVRPAPNGGYYIVVGSGIPRIDVIGYSREVDFPQLINRVQAATEAGSPTFD